jgi:hypothetical protein
MESFESRGPCPAADRLLKAGGRLVDAIGAVVGIVLAPSSNASFT